MPVFQNKQSPEIYEYTTRLQQGASVTRQNDHSGGSLAVYVHGLPQIHLNTAPGLGEEVIILHGTPEEQLKMELVNMKHEEVGTHRTIYNYSIVLDKTPLIVKKAGKILQIKKIVPEAEHYHFAGLRELGDFWAVMKKADGSFNSIGVSQNYFSDVAHTGYNSNSTEFRISAKGGGTFATFKRGAFVKDISVNVGGKTLVTKIYKIIWSEEIISVENWQVGEG